MPQGVCILSDWGGRERPDRLKNLQVAGGTMGVTWSDDVAVIDEAGDEGDTEALCGDAHDAVKPRFGRR